ncbi:hypothetical protein KA005_84840, partial [bacterium]|nr:hypothetical protein [bacterium]
SFGRVGRGGEGVSSYNHRYLVDVKYQFCFEDFRTRRATHDMILVMAKYGNHGIRHKFVSVANVKRFFQVHYHCDWKNLVQTCRKTSELVPVVENLVGSTWTVPGCGSRAAIVTGAATEEEKEITALEGPGTLTTSTYLQFFENAVDNFHRCMERVSFGDFQSSVTNGIASIGTYIEYRTWLYNSGQPSAPLVDSKKNKVPQDTKIDEWIPKMSGGKKLDKSRINWRDFKTLRNVRHDLAIHVKQPAISTSYKQLCVLLNLFRSGIAGLLLDLHLLFAEPIPSKIIRYAYLPDVKLVKTQD